jgi:hypothetical protein
MTTQTFTVVAATPLSALVGNYIVRQVIFNGTGAGVLSVYDSADTSLTQSNAAYAYNTRNCSYTRTVTGVRDLACNTNSYDYAGISDAATTIAANATYALPAMAALGIPGAGQTVADMQAVFELGVLLNSTVGGTVQITYDIAK